MVPKISATPEYQLELPESVSAPVYSGDRLGTLYVSVGGQALAEVPVCAAESVPRIGFFVILKMLAGSLFGL